MGLSFRGVCGWLVGPHRRGLRVREAGALFNAGTRSANTEMAPHMVTINPIFHRSPARPVSPDPAMPIFIPASDLPDVYLLSPADGAEEDSYTTYDVTKNPAVAHKIALQWLAAERAMRKRASEKEAERLRAEAAAEALAAAEEAVVTEEAKELRLAYYDDACPDWSQLGPSARQPWLRQAREALQRHGKLGKS